MTGNRGFGPGSAYRFTSYRHGSLDGRNNNFRYPSQWWDVAHMEMPTSVKHLFKWCRYHAVANPLIATVVRKLSAYPITKVIVDEQKEEGFNKHKRRWEDFLFRGINVNKFQIDVGLDYHTYGNCVVSIKYPFHKYLECKKCKYRERISKLRFQKQWDFRNFEYYLHCPECDTNDKAKVEDAFYKSVRDVKLIRWNPADLDIDYNPITQTTEFAYKVPSQIRKKVLSKNKRYLEEMPQKFIEAMKFRKPVVLASENVFHFKAPTPSLSGNEEGWGYPPILPALKDSFYLQIMKKAQEAVMLEHLVPLDIIFPASNDSNASPYTTVNLSDWKKKIEGELVQWRMDPNYKPILPLPIGYQRIGGNGRALMLTQEIRAMSEHIIVGMGVPQEFVFGGLSWTGSSVSLRMLENQFLTYRDMHEHFLRHFLVPNISRFMGWMEVDLHMKTFKMADDVQTKQLLLSLNSMKKVSDKTLLAEFDKDSMAELKLIEQEVRRNLEISKLDSIYKAQIQGESGLVGSKYQTEARIEMQKAMAEAQQEMQESGLAPPMGPGGGPPGGAPPMGGAPPQGGGGSQNVDVTMLADTYARKLNGLEPELKATFLQRMQEDNPNLHEMVTERMLTAQAQDIKPLPEKRPPRRGDAVI